MLKGLCALSSFFGYCRRSYSALFDSILVKFLALLLIQVYDKSTLRLDYLTFAHTHWTRGPLKHHTVAMNHRVSMTRQ